MEVSIEQSWKQVLQHEFEKDYFISLINNVKKSYQTSKVYPSGKNIFAAFDNTPIDQVKVVILGQDPYHGPNQANGLSFSVNPGIAFPPSLQNIFKELKDDLNQPVPADGNLERWAKQGVFLLNSTLTVEANKAGSHQNLGWEIFTDQVIKTLSDKRENLVFILWGAFAQKKMKLIDESKHFIIKSAHPSPLSVYRGFWGSKPFSRSNTYLEAHHIEPIKW